MARWVRVGILERTRMEGLTDDDKDILNWQKGGFVV